LTSRRLRTLRTWAILAAREWFSPQRWSVNDALMAVAAIVLGGSVLGPWFRATVKFKTAPLVGSLIEPKGSESGIEAHRFLLAVGANDPGAQPGRGVDQSVAHGLRPR